MGSIMKLTITSDDNVFAMDVGGDMELENLIAYCQSETDIPLDKIQLIHNGHVLGESSYKKTVAQLGIVDGDMIFLTQKSIAQPAQQAPQRPASSAPRPQASSSSQSLNDRLGPQEITLEQASTLRQSFMSNPHELTSLKLSNPHLADALEGGNLDTFHRVLNEQHKHRRDEQARKMRMLTADPFDIEAQRMIQEQIEREQIDSNMETALEFMPEAFGQVHMLYIRCKVNGFMIDAFVDSGAQSTIMSKACAERCNITRLVDKRWSGIAQGVGTQRILGRIHLCQIQIENDFLVSSFSVLEEQPMDMLLGLDMLKRHQCVIDLERNILKIGTTGTETKFLNESELPNHARVNMAPNQS